MFGIMFNEEIDNFASDTMYLWYDDDDREARISVMGDKLYDANDKFTPLGHVLHSWMGKPLTQEGLKDGLAMIEPYTAHIKPDKVLVRFSNKRGDKGGVNGFVMPFTNAIMQARHLMFTGREWYSEPNKRSPYVVCCNGDVPLPERRMMFWFLMARRAAQLLK
jgi:hypothetical protein